MKDIFGRVEILKIKISNLNFNQALEEVKKWLTNGGKKHYLVTPNPEILVASQKNGRLRQILNQADLALPDGMGLLWASRILGRPLRERVAGVDFMEKLCELAAKEGLRVGLIGGKEGIAAKAAECLKKRYPKLRVVLAAGEWNKVDMLSSGANSRLAGPASLHPHPTSSSGFAGDAGARWGSPALATRHTVNGKDNSQLDNLKIRNLPIDLLFVAFGAPKQEIWISENLGKLPVKVAMGVGGAFDYLAGGVPRAPKWIQTLGLEWLFRLAREPWRIRRQLALFKFIYLILRQRFGRIRNIN